MDETEILKRDVKSNNVIHFDYSSTEVMQKHTCDTYHILMKILLESFSSYSQM